ncbi:hypothetical protein SAMN05444063_1143 [Pseudomonas syringae]|nr:hypothetical protein SAMN05444063_1143 [Pseudomonas syringae]
MSVATLGRGGVNVTREEMQLHTLDVWYSRITEMDDID